MSVFCDDRSVELFERKKYPQGHSMPYAHYHNHHELYYLLNGKATYWIGNEMYHLQAGDFVFAPQGEIHQTNYDGAKNIERLLFIFNDEFIGEEYALYVAQMTQKKHIRLSQDSLSEIHSIFNKIEFESTNDSPYKKAFQKNYMRLLLLCIARYGLSDIPNELSPTLEIIRDAVRYINENFSQQLDVNSLAKSYSLSLGYFSKQFKKYTGVAPSEYITITRIKAAQKMLATTKKSITEVAFDCGYNDSVYFTRMFKKITGMPPKKYSMRFL